MADKQEVAKSLLQDSNWINKVQGVMQENVMGLFDKFYQGAHNILYSTAVTTIILLMVSIWLLKRLKNGYPTREEWFQAIERMFFLILLFGVLYSFNTYTGFLYILTIPENAITAVVSSIFKNTDFGNLVTEAMNKVDNIRAMMWQYGTKEYLKEQQLLGFNGPIDHIMSYLVTFVLMIPFWIFYLMFLILLAGVVILIFFSKFTAFLILSTLPLVLPFLLYYRFLPYLWSWYKLYLSYAFIAPLAFIPLNLALNPITQLETYQNNIAELYIKQFEYLITGTITCITAIFIMKKVPSWINSVLGTQMEANAGGVNAGAVATGIAGKTILGGLVSRAMGKGFFAGAGKSLEQSTGVGVFSKIVKGFKGGHVEP